MTNDPKRNHYKVMMLAEHVDPEIVTTVYRKLAQRYHPDVDPSGQAAHRMAEINEAYEVLGDPQKRARYDAWLSSRRDRRVMDRYIRQPSEVTAFGPAGEPVGPPSGSVVDFGRYAGWTLGQIKRADPQFLEWLQRVPAGRPLKEEIGKMLSRRD